MRNSSAPFLVSLNAATKRVCGFALENGNKNCKYIFRAFILMKYGNVRKFIDDLILYWVPVRQKQKFKLKKMQLKRGGKEKSGKKEVKLESKIRK